MNSNRDDSPELALGMERRNQPAATPTAEDLSRFKGRRLPPNGTPMRLLGVDYLHVPTTNGGDLYLTRFGIPLYEHLQLENWGKKSGLKRSANVCSAPASFTAFPLRWLMDGPLTLW